MRGNSLRVCLIALAGLLLPICGSAQEASKIIDQYLKAAGGSKNLSKVRTLLIDGSIQSSGAAAPGTYSFRVKLPNRYYMELRNAGKTEIEAYNGKSAWHQADAGQFATLLGPQALELEAAAQYYNSRMEQLSKNKVVATFQQNAAVHGRPVYQVELTYPTGVQWQVFFDQQTHLIAGEKTTLAGIPLEIYYDDYRTVEGGIKVPYKMEIRRGDQTYVVSVTRADVNGMIGERVFDFPIQSQVKLPDLKQLFAEIDKNQKEIDKIKENYAGTQVEDEIEYDKNGKVTKKESNEYTFFYLNGDEITTLVKKDGKSLSEEEQKKENEKTQKRIERRKKTKRRKKRRKRRKKRKEKNQKTLMTRILSRFCMSASL